MLAAVRPSVGSWVLAVAALLAVGSFVAARRTRHPRPASQGFPVVGSPTPLLVHHFRRLMFSYQLRPYSPSPADSDVVAALERGKAMYPDRSFWIFVGRCPVLVAHTNECVKKVLLADSGTLLVKGIDYDAHAVSVLRLRFPHLTFALAFEKIYNPPHSHAHSPPLVFFLPSLFLSSSFFIPPSSLFFFFLS
jgi:hypothetical protein